MNHAALSRHVASLLEQAGIAIGGPLPTEIHIHDDRWFLRSRATKPSVPR